MTEADLVSCPSLAILGGAGSGKTALLSRLSDILRSRGKTAAFSLPENGSPLPDALFLDDCPRGVSPAGLDGLASRLSSLSEAGVQIFLASEDFDFAQRTCRTAVLMDRGQIVAAQPMSLLAPMKHKTYILRFLDPEKAAAMAKDPRVKVLCADKLSITAYVPGSLIGFLQISSEYDTQSFSSAIHTVPQLIEYHFPGK